MKAVNISLAVLVCILLCLLLVAAVAWHSIGSTGSSAEHHWSKWTNDWPEPGRTGFSDTPCMEQSRYDTNTGEIQIEIH